MGKDTKWGTVVADHLGESRPKQSTEQRTDNYTAHQKTLAPTLNEVKITLMKLNLLI